MILFVVFYCRNYCNYCNLPYKERHRYADVQKKALNDFLFNCTTERQIEKRKSEFIHDRETIAIYCHFNKLDK
jgi:hypothetical protein